MKDVNIFNLMNLIPKWVWWGGVSPHWWAWCYNQGYGNCKCCMLRILVDFMMLSDIYCFLFWVGRWYLLSTCVCTDPLLLCFVFFVNCGVQQTYRRLQLNRNSSQSSPRQISGWAKASSLDWIFFFMSWCLEVLA